MPELLDRCELSRLRHFADPNGLLVVNAQLGEPFPLKRVFTVLAPRGAVRGKHAHRTCSQYLTAQTGEIVVTVSDGDTNRGFRLDSPFVGLLIPPMVWASEFFASDSASLLVMCDKEYEESDYIRSWDEYLELRASKVRR